jgi:DNA-3-methyladenine glycosylase II
MALKQAHRLLTEADLAAGVAALARQCRHMRAIHKRRGLPSLRHVPADFSGLAKIVTGQQLSAQSAAAIWARVSAALAPFEAQGLLKLEDAELAAFGLSRAKIKTLRAAAAAVAAGGLDFRALNRRSDAAVHETLTGLHGIGPWTADIYLLFALRRADAFAPADLALQIAAERIFELQQRPSPAQLLELAERWRPWRGVAARLLWAEYGAVRAETAGRPRQKA